MLKCKVQRHGTDTERQKSNSDSKLDLIFECTKLLINKLTTGTFRHQLPRSLFMQKIRTHLQNTPGQSCMLRGPRAAATPVVPSHAVSRTVPAADGPLGNRGSTFPCRMSDPSPLNLGHQKGKKGGTQGRKYHILEQGRSRVCRTAPTLQRGPS